MHFGCTSKVAAVFSLWWDPAETMIEKASNSGDVGTYILGTILGICAGILDVKIGDLLLTALFVLVSAMLLGALRPQKPWRWTITIALFVPVVQFLAYIFLTEKPYAAQIYESFLGFLTGIAGAYGGSFFRRGVNEILKR